MAYLRTNAPKKVSVGEVFSLTAKIQPEFEEEYGVEGYSLSFRGNSMVGFFNQEVEVDQWYSRKFKAEKIGKHTVAVEVYYNRHWLTQWLFEVEVV